MARITVWGDFKVNQTEHLNMSGELQLLLNGSDCNVVNYEAPIDQVGKPIPKSGPNHKQSRSGPSWLQEHGFNLIALANNHIMDYGREALEATIASFDRVQIMGAGEWNQAYRIEKVTTRDGLTVGFLNASHAEFGTLRHKDLDSVGYAWCQHPDFERLIRNRQGLDYLIVIQHGGVEYMDLPLPEWRDIYRRWIELGADAVIASHPHVPQGWEVYQGKPICYSLGNFCFQKEKTSRRYWYEGVCCILNLDDQEEIRVTLKPIRYDQKKGYIYSNESREFADHMEELNRILQNEEEYLRRVNSDVLHLYDQYRGMITRGGWLADILSKSFLKGIVEGFRKEHIYNCVNCESHRWALTRAMRLKYKI